MFAGSTIIDKVLFYYIKLARTGKRDNILTVCRVAITMTRRIYHNKTELKTYQSPKLPDIGILAVRPIAKPYRDLFLHKLECMVQYISIYGASNEKKQVPPKSVCFS